jgi:hypothetical protein
MEMKIGITTYEKSKEIRIFNKNEKRGKFEVKLSKKKNDKEIG